MAQVGRYYGGHRYCVIGPNGTRIASTAPSSQQVEYTYAADQYGPAETVTSWRHGLQIIGDWSDVYDGNGVGPTSQPFDGRTRDFGGNGPASYDHAKNRNPGATGAAALISEPCTALQALSLSDASVAGGNPARGYLARRDVLFFIDDAPVTDALPPPIGATPLVSRYTKSDIDLADFPSLTPTPGAPSPALLLNRLRWTSNFEWTYRPQGDYYAGASYEGVYASTQASLYADVALALCGSIDTTNRDLLAAHVVIHAQNIVECLNAGARYNYNIGLGGILAGRKIFVVLAYILTGDSYFGDWASRTDWAAEDRQVKYVTAADVAAYDYEAADEGMPDWTGNWLRDPSGITRSLTASTYRAIFFQHCVGQALACTLIGGAKSAWNNPAFFDYVDRMMERTAYDGSGPNKWGASLTGTNSPSAFHKAMWAAYRTGAGMPALWDWP